MLDFIIRGDEIFLLELTPRLESGETTLTAEVVRYIAEQPGDWAALMATKTWLWFAIGCILALPFLMIAFGALSGTLDERGFGGANWLSLSYSLWEGFLCISMVITILNWFRRRFDHQGRLAQIMSRTSFAVYIIHPAIIVPLALSLSDIHMNLSLKFLLVAPIAIVLCYLITYGLLKIPIVRTILG